MHSFCELGPKLLHSGHYLLTEVFCQDPLERYFSKQRHRGGSNDNPTVREYLQNVATLHSRQQLGNDRRTMNVSPEKFTSAIAGNTDGNDELQLPKRKRQKLNKTK